MQDLLRKIKRLMQGGSPKTTGGEQAFDPVVVERIRGLMAALATTEPEELACDEVYDVLDQYAELDLREEDVALLMPLVKHHLHRCSECNEEYQTLLEMLHVNDTLT